VQGPSIDGKGEFSLLRAFDPVGREPTLGAPDPRGHAQNEQMMDPEGVVEKAKKLF